MNRLLRITVLGVACSLAAAAGGLAARAVEPGGASPHPATPPAGTAIAKVDVQEEFRVLGARSCAAAACHGSATPDTRPGRIRRNEYLFWFDRDPHARAGRTLSSQRSQQMLHLLGIVREGAVVDRRGYENCLACHTTMSPSAQQPEEEFLAAKINAGVDCEACHGAAERWIDLHYRDDWNPAKGAQLGMRDLQNPRLRAQFCAPCHVGSPQREVDHDMIAAGHPPLKFELTGFHASLPKHWSDQELRSADADFELKLWQAGQETAARAALELLGARASRAAAGEAHKVWPELAEYDCFACHHNLAPIAPARGSQRGSNSPVIAPWSSWYEAGYLLAKAGQAGNFNPIRAPMESGVLPDAPAVAEGVQRVLEEITSSGAAADDGAPGGEELASAVLGRLQNNPALNWDEATQLYLALAAADAARRDALQNSGQAPSQQDQPRVALLRQLRSLLAFPAGYDSPKDSPLRMQRSASGQATAETVLQNLQEAAATFAPR